MSNIVEKLIEEIFADFQNGGNLRKAIIKKVNLYKKTNRFEILLQSNVEIDIKDVHNFEIYLIERFKFEVVIVKIDYTEDIEVDIAQKWQDIINYMAYKYPSVKAILRNSVIAFEDDKTINVDLQLKGAEILYARGMDNVFSEIIYNIYGKRYKIKYFDNESQERVEEYKENARKLEEEAIRKANKEAAEQRREAMAEERKRVEAREQELLARRNSNQNANAQNAIANGNANTGNVNDQANANTVADNKKTQAESIPTVSKATEDEEQSPLIYGRSANIKDPLLKIVDLSIDTGKACIDGEIVNMGDTRELKTGKILIPFDVYDGSSTITCKIFAEADKSKDIIKRLKGAARSKSFCQCTI